MTDPSTSPPSPEAGPPAPEAQPSPAPGPSNPAVDHRPWSLWSIASMVCATLLVPPFCLIAPILGLAGLSEARYKKYRGGRLAAGGVVLGFLATVGWTIIAVQVAAGTRPLLLHGPVETLNAGVNGNLEVFQRGFWGPGREAPEAEAERFLAGLRARHGRVISSQQAEDQPDSVADPVEEGQARIRYEMKFERGAAAVEAVFVQHAPGRPLPWVLRWRSIRVIGPAGEDLEYPPIPAPAPAGSSSGDDGIGSDEGPGS